MLGIAGFFLARQALAETRALRATMHDPAPARAARIAASVAVLPPPVAPQPPARPRIDIEQALTQRWGVWLGAAALLPAAVFLVRTGVEQGWLVPTPRSRCALAFVVGSLLIAMAEWLRRRPAPSSSTVDYAPSALAAGGIGTWLACAYATGPMYALVSPLAGFVLVAAAGLAGLALSLRFCPLVAAVGLAGAFATPLLVDTGSSFAAGLFGYLLLVSAAAWAVVRPTAWTWLGWAASVAGTAWIILHALSAGAEATAPGLFVPAAVALSLALLPGAALDHPVGRRLSWAPFLLLGLAGPAARPSPSRASSKPCCPAPGRPASSCRSWKLPAPWRGGSPLPAYGSSAARPGRSPGRPLPLRLRC